MLIWGDMTSRIAVLVLLCTCTAACTTKKSKLIDAAIADAPSPLDVPVIDAPVTDAPVDAPALDAPATDTGMPDAALDAGPPRPEGTIRIMAANLTSGTLQSYDPGEGLRIIQGLDPDVILIQEFSIGANDDSAVRAFVDAACGEECAYSREPVSSGSIPNGVISRFPIVDSGIWDDTSMTNREYAWARLDVPGDANLWAVSIHFKSGGDGAERRRAEAAELVTYMRANVPDEDLLVVGGDTNIYSTDAGSEPAITALSKLLSLSPLPDDGTGNTGTSSQRLVPSSLRQPYDRVLPDPELRALAVPVRVGANVFPNGLVFDSRVYTPLEDVAPVMYDDSYAPNMQHMAVVMDFALVDEI